MKSITLVACEKCGQVFRNERLAAWHEKDCKELRVGQLVEAVYYGLLIKGRIVRFAEGDKIGGETTVHLDEVEPPVPLNEGGAPHIWVLRREVVRVINKDEKKVA